MAYRFLTDTTVEANVHRILSEQLDKAVQQLSENFKESPGEAIHKARRHLKKGRSLLRLVRQSLDQDTYKKENKSLRDIGRSLAPARDGAVYPATLDELLKTYGLTLDVSGFADLQAGLTDLSQDKLAKLTDRDRFVDAIVDDLESTRARLDQIALKKPGWKAISKGLKQIYHQGQDRFALAYDGGDDEAFHEWRKRVKDLWHNTCLLRSLWPPVMDAFQSEAHQLASLLGDDHDIAALRQFLLHHPREVAVKEVHMQVLLPLMSHRQDKLHHQARALGQKLYGETPKAFTHRMASYWHA